MSKYLLIESNSPFDSVGVCGNYELATSLAEDGNDVTLFLVQNGVLPARKGAADGGLKGVIEDGVEVLADEFSLRERGISEDGLAPGVKPTPIEVAVDQLAEGRKAIWL